MAKLIELSNQKAEKLYPVTSSEGTFFSDGTNLEDLYIKEIKEENALFLTAVNLKNKTGSRGDCTILYGEMNGIVDFGADPNCTDLIRVLRTKNINKIHYAIISHYHSDHVTTNFETALKKLINAKIDFSECTFYLPHLGIDWSRFIANSAGEYDRPTSNETHVLNALRDNKIKYIYPQNEQSIDVSQHTKISFYNIGDYNDYYTNNIGARSTTEQTLYNNFCMLTIVEHKNNKIVLSADLYYAAQEKNYQYVTNCDIYKSEHHATNSIVSDKWHDAISPKYVYIGQYSSTTWNTLDLITSQTEDYCNKGAILSYTGEGDITYKIGKEGVTLIEGIPHDLSKEKTNKGGKIIHANSEKDLNNYFEPGEYQCPYTAVAATLLNCPVDKAFRLQVENSRGQDYDGDTFYRKQILTPYYSSYQGENYYTRYLRKNATTGAITATTWYIYNPFATLSERSINIDTIFTNTYRNYGIFRTGSTIQGTFPADSTKNGFLIYLPWSASTDYQYFINVDGTLYSRYYSHSSNTLTDWVRPGSKNSSVTAVSQNIFDPSSLSYKQSGNVIMVKIEGAFETITAKTPWTTIATGLPTTDVILPQNLPLNNGEGSIRARVTTTGQLQISANESASGKSFGSTYMYISTT